MAELIALLAIVALSLLIVRVGTVVLEKTGLSREVAAFQAQSAFMGVGFTTRESESVVGHPVRRRIVRVLMLLGFGAITSTLGTLVVTFARSGEGGLHEGAKALILLLGILALALVVRVPQVDRMMDRLIAAALARMTSIELIDFHELLELDKGYTVATLTVQAGTWLDRRTLRELALADEGVLVLNIRRETGLVIGTPASRTRLHAGDRLLVYALEGALEDLTQRPAGAEGERLHAEAVTRQRLRLAGERREDLAAESAG